ncbi:MAG TPA: hypothetical protein VMT46_10770 [Anaerolineaceae bacterium]|nr:hypothetical protein [Anaerolineaceae bacterium]
MQISLRPAGLLVALVRPFHRLAAALGWTRASYTLFSIFLAIIALILVVWWPLVVEYASSYDPRYPFWVQFDWLLLGIFAAMSLLIMTGADLKKDALIVFVGLCGGLAIEGWGTQTRLWTYYTLERPPLWIIPAWPIASLSIDRLVRLLDRRLPAVAPGPLRAAYWPVFLAFFALMLVFVWPTIMKPFTPLALLTVALLILTPTDHRFALLTFAAGSGLGYFLEVWGTTHACWTYYTLQTPPLFAVLAHGLAAVAFWRAGLVIKLGVFYEAVRPG